MLPAPFAYGETAAAAFLDLCRPLLWLRPMFQLCACHSDIPQYNSSETFRNVPLLLSHVCLCAVRFDGYDGAAGAAKSAKVIGNVKISTVTGNSSNRAYFYATAFELIFSIVFRIPIQTVRSVNTSTMLPWSVNGASCKTDRSFIMPLWTMYSTI